MSIKVGVVGAAGFAGIELVRLLVEHPSFDLCAVTSDSLAGTRVSSLYPALTGQTELEFTPHASEAFASCDAVFLAVPHTAAMAQVPALLAAGVSVFDLSADYRLRNVATYEQWYAPHTSSELLERAAFGLPELFADGLAAAAEKRAAGEPALVACAGCYPTATSLAAFPALNAGIVASGTPVVVDAISGITGAGKKATERTHFCFANESVEAYGVGKHRHTPEIEQILDLPGRVIFTPHLAPMNRGLHSTVYLPLAPDERGIALEEVHAAYRSFYAQSPFVNVLDLGCMPKTSSVAGSNACHVGIALAATGDMLIACGAIDNLCKGAAGQAVQCANIVFGLPETTGLALSGLPV